MLAGRVLLSLFSATEADAQNIQMIQYHSFSGIQIDHEKPQSAITGRFTDAQRHSQNFCLMQFFRISLMF